MNDGSSEISFERSFLLNSADVDEPTAKAIKNYYQERTITVYLCNALVAETEMGVELLAHFRHN